ncbi:MAG: acyl-CoA dehydrogenase [Salinisphaera sp.]|nr:acyl-CoA dehydrogenase [Salinisphaera sp.]
MTTLIVALAIIALYWVLLYRGVSLALFTAITGALLLGLWSMGAYGLPGLIVAAVLFVPPALLLNVGPLRRRLISTPVFRVLRKSMPEMNRTEREALEAGDVWWEAQMFRGRPDWSELLDFQYTRLTGEEQAFLDGPTDQLCAMVDDWQVNFELKDLPPEVWAFIRAQGFFAMLIPKSHGGLGFSAYAQSCVVAKIATRSLTAAVTVMVPNSLGPGELLVHYGTKQQQQRWLPGLASGKEIPCFALTGPEAGSDATAMPDSGVVEKREVDGEQVLGLRLSFSKRYITLAPVATLVGLAFKLKDPDGLLGDADTTDYGITCALLPADTPGMEIGRRHYPGAAFMNGPIKGEDVFVPLDAIIGGREGIGAGWRMLVECLSAGRGISLPALATATGKGMYGITAAYTKIRRQFGVPIGRFEGVQEALGRIGGYAYALEACRNLTASAVDNCSPSVVTGMMKYHMTEMMRSVINDAMDIHGGRGIIMGPRNYLAAGYQATPVAITVEGANIMTRNLMVFGQGAIRCHPYVFAEMEAAGNPDFDAALQEFDGLLFGHMAYSINRGVRALTLGLTGARIARAPVSGAMAPYYRQLERYSASLAFASDVAMGALGGSLKLRERTSARLGDMLSHLYMASATLRYVHEHGETQTDLIHARWVLEHHLAELDHALHEVIRNFPVKAIRPLLKIVTMPLGRRFDGPSDADTAAVCGQMLDVKPSEGLMQRLRYDLYIGAGADDPGGRMLHAVDKLHEVEVPYEALLKAVKKGEVSGDDIDAQLRDAVDQGRITQTEANAIREYDALRYDAVLTDDFSQAYLRDPLSATQEDRPAQLRAAG